MTFPPRKHALFDVSAFEPTSTPTVTPLESGSLHKTVVDRSGDTIRIVPNPLLWGIGPSDTLLSVNVVREGGGALTLHVKRDICEVYEADNRVRWSRYRCESQHHVAAHQVLYATDMLEGLAGMVPIRYASEALAVTPPAARSWFAI